MAIFTINGERLHELSAATFSAVGIRERGDIQRMLRDQVTIVSPDTLVIDEEFGDWADSRRRIDLLGIDRLANLVVIELKRTEDGGHMDLQAIRYAAMISAMTFERAVEIFGDYLRRRGDRRDARDTLLEFLDWEEPDDDAFGNDVKVVLVSADFSKEITTCALWLAGYGIDMRCVRLRPYADGDRLLLDVQQLIPLPEAEDYQVRLREKVQEARRTKGVSLTEDRLLQHLRGRCGNVAADVGQELLHWVTPKVDYIFWGTGNQSAGAIAIRTVGRVKYHILRIGSKGGAVFLLDRLHQKVPFNQAHIQQEFVERLNRLPGVKVSVANLRCKPKVALASLTTPLAVQQVKDLVHWILEQVPAR